MVKRFCDICGIEIPQAFFSWVIPHENLLVKVEVQADSKIPADACDSCVAQIIVESFPEIKKKFDAKMEEVQAELQDLQTEKDSLLEENAALQSLQRQLGNI
jgi:hypothetical protein